MSDHLEKIKARIRALLAKTTANGCTEGEAMVAAAKAAQMLRDHGLEAQGLEIGPIDRPLHRQKRVKLDDLLGHLALACRCKVILVKRADGLTVRFIGRLPWPEVATWLHETLEAAHRRAMAEFRAAPEYRRWRTSRTRAQARNRFTAGYVEGLKRKLADLAWPHLDEIRSELAVVKRVHPERGTPLNDLCQAGSGRDRTAGIRAGMETNVAWGLQGGGKPGQLTHSEVERAG